MQRLVIAACVIIAVVFSFTTVADGQDKSNGEIQLERLLADRPDMRGIFPKDDVVLRWVNRSFEFGRSGEPVVWGDGEPVNGMAEHTPTRKALVRVTNRDDISGRDKWYLLVFELFNLVPAGNVLDLEVRAESGELSRVEFANLILQHEYRQMKASNRFFKRYPILGATPENAPLYNEYMGAMRENGAKVAVPQPDPQFPGHYEHYGKWYDLIRARGLAKKK